MGYKQFKIKESTEKLVDECVQSFRNHHPELDHIHVSRDKIVYEIANFYMKVK